MKKTNVYNKYVKKLRTIKHDTVAIVPIRFLVLLLVLFICIVLIYTSYFYEPLTYRNCASNNIKNFEGLLKGFQINEDNSDYIDVSLGNMTLVFDIFHEEYMQSMIGFNINISCCEKSNDCFEIYYNFIGAKIV